MGRAASPEQTQKLAILLWRSSPDHPAECAGPFVYAAVAGAMDCEVEIHFSGKSVLLLTPGVAARLFPGKAEAKSIYEFMQEAATLGARFLGCSMAMNEHLPPGTACIPEYSGAAGAAAFIMRTLDPEWRTLVF